MSSRTVSKEDLFGSTTDVPSRSVENLKKYKTTSGYEDNNEEASINNNKPQESSGHIK